MASLYKVLKDLNVPMNWDAPTVTGKTWGERVAAIPVAVSPDLPQERSVIRIKPIRDISGTDIMRGNFFSSCTLKVAGMSTDSYNRFNGKVFLVRYYENETQCNQELRSSSLEETLSQMPELTPELLSALRKFNDAPADQDILTMINNGTLAFAFVIAGQGPKAFGMPEMFAPSQYLRHHGVVERTSMMITDGRYSGVTKGACVGHMVPEAFEWRRHRHAGQRRPAVGATDRQTHRPDRPQRFPTRRNRAVEQCSVRRTQGNSRRSPGQDREPPASNRRMQRTRQCLDR